VRGAGWLIFALLGPAGPALADEPPRCPLLPPVEEVEPAHMPPILRAAVLRDVGDMGLSGGPSVAGRQLLWVRKQGTRWVVAYQDGDRDGVVSYEIGYDGSLAGVRKDVAFPATVCQLTERELWR
jgi:hypothetical protein